MNIGFIKFLCIFICSINSFVCSLNIINLTVQPTYAINTKDSFSKIKCKVNDSSAKYSWLYVDDNTKTEHPVVLNQYISFSEDGIMVLNHQTSTAGKYRCRAMIPLIGTVISQIFQVDLAEVFVNKLSQTALGSGYYKVGDRVILTCPYTYVPLQAEMEYEWTMKIGTRSKRITQTKTTVFHQNGRFLEIEVEKFSFGNYFCTALYSKYGWERRSFDINVQKFVDSGVNKRPLLQWVINPIESLYLDNSDLRERYIKIKNGRYTLITKEGTNRLELICAANSNDSSAVEILWYKNKVRIDRAAIQYDRFNYEITGQGTLVLINTTTDYNGLFTCQALLKRNSSIAIKYSFNLSIRPQLRFIKKPPPIIVKEKHTEIVLSCRLNDVESSNNIVWRKNGELISGNNYFHQNEGYLRISKLLNSDEGIFQCLADNEFSSIEATVQLKIKKQKKAGFIDNLPFPVKDLRVKAVSFGTLNISWNHAIFGFETISHYEIVLIDLSDLSIDKSKITLKADRLESSVLVENLVPDSFYKIFVHSVNGSGRSYPAVINSSPRVLSNAPTASPANIRVYDIGSGVAKISWDPPNKHQINGELINYRVHVVSSDSFYSKVIDVNPQGKLQLSDLTANTKYMVQVQASTRGGRGPLSDSISFETKDNPNKYDESFNQLQKLRVKAPRKNLLNPSMNDNSKSIPPSAITSWRAKGLNTSIELQWSHPTGGGPVTTYTIEWGKVYPGPQHVTLKYPINSYLINNLELRTQYMIKIIPINGASPGMELLFSHSTGNPNIKSIPIPLNLNINQIEKTWVVITWEDPSNDVSNTRLYQIRYSSTDKDFPSNELKNTTEKNVQITGLRTATSYSFSVRTGDVIPPRDGEYINKEWAWSEWSLKESFSTKGERPTNSPQNLKLVTIGEPDVRNTDVYTKVALSWSSPITNETVRYDDITRYTIYFTSEPKTDISNWPSQALPSDQYSSEIRLNGIQKIYYFRVGCQTKHFECPLSPLLLYKTSDKKKQNFGLLRIPDKYRNTVDIPAKYLKSQPVLTLDVFTEEPIRQNRDAWYIMVGIGFGVVIFLIALMILIFLWCRRRSQSSFTGYKLGTKSSIQHIGGAGLLLSNQSPALSNGKVSPHFVTNFNQSLKTPDLFPHPEPHFGDLESDSNQDNDSLRFASVSQHHLASTSGVTNMFNPTIQNHSIIRSHPQMVSYYSDIPSHSKSAINASTILNPLINNSISIPIQIQDNSLQRATHQNSVFAYQGHPFTQHLLSTGPGMPICSSSCLQPIHLPPQMIPTPHEVHSPANFSNTPRVNASELASHTSSEDIRPVMMNCSRVSDSDMFQYYGSAGNSTGKSQKTSVSNKSHADTLRNSDVIKSGIDSSQSESEVTKGFSTEELSQEMANLEGLMKDLNAITQKEFEC